MGDVEEMVIDTAVGAAGPRPGHRGGDRRPRRQRARLLRRRRGAVPARPEVPEPKPESDPLNDWLATKPTKNTEYAQWILDGKVHGFVVVHFSQSETQLTSLAAGEKVFAADPAQEAIFGSLETIAALVTAMAKKWQADSSEPKEPLAVGSFLREGSSGHSGRATDINRMDWTSADGPVQVEEALRALPAGKYGVGLPFQGEFFPIGEWLTVRKQMRWRRPVRVASRSRSRTRRSRSSPPSGSPQRTPTASGLTRRSPAARSAASRARP